MSAAFARIDSYNRDPAGVIHRERFIQICFYLCSVIGAVSFLLFFPRDLLAGLDNIQSLILIRLSSLAALSLNLVIGLIYCRGRCCRYRRDDANFSESAVCWRNFVLSGFVITSVGVAALTAAAGGFEGTYWFGFCMILVFWFAQPFSYKFLLGASLLASAAYFASVMALTADSFSFEVALVPALNTLAIIMLGTINAFISNHNAMELFYNEQALLEEKKKSEALLLNILPGGIAERLKNGEQSISDYFDRVAILFADIVGFTNFCHQRNSEEIVEVLNQIMGAFDCQTEKLGLEKIKTIGDGYMVMAGGLKQRDDDLHKIVELGIYMIEFIRGYSADHDLNLELRVGINLGSVTAGVIGRTKFAFDLWGDTVNVASRMESSGIPMAIQIPAEVAAELGDQYSVEERGEIEIKGRGPMKTYYIRV